MPINRRNILRGAVLALGAMMPGAAMSRIDDHGVLFQSPRAARTVGTHYLAQHPEERNAARLRQGLLAGAPTETGALRGHIQAKCRQDFAAGHTVVVDGWILARSEARACALVALGALVA